jgi:uncharacterized protein YlxP (DUF503 family)
MKRLMLLLVLFITMPGLAHKYYVSIAEMEYDKANKRIKVSLKVTAHDFEHVLEDKFDKRIHIEQYNDSSQVMLYAQEYLEKSIKVYSADKPCVFNYIGKEVTLREDLYFYFSFTNVQDPSTIKIVNTLLFSLSNQQQNIVHYKYNNQTKSVTLLPAQSEAQISFD